jgi:hypothetical protein
MGKDGETNKDSLSVIVTFQTGCVVESIITTTIIITVIIIIITIIINVEHEMHCHTSNHWGHRSCEQKFTKISGNNIRTTLNRFPTKTAILGTSYIIRKVLQAET